MSAINGFNWPDEKLLQIMNEVVILACADPKSYRTLSYIDDMISL